MFAAVHEFFGARKKKEAIAMNLHIRFNLEWHDKLLLTLGASIKSCFVETFYRNLGKNLFDSFEKANRFNMRMGCWQKGVIFWQSKMGLIQQVDEEEVEP